MQATAKWVAFIRKVTTSRNYGHEWLYLLSLVFYLFVDKEQKNNEHDAAFFFHFLMMCAFKLAVSLGFGLRTSISNLNDWPSHATLDWGSVLISNMHISCKWNISICTMEEWQEPFARPVHDDM